MTAPTTTPQDTISDNDDNDMTHIVCVCTDRWTLCGMDADSMAWIDDGTAGQVCVVCVDLLHSECRRCGRKL